VNGSFARFRRKRPDSPDLFGRNDSMKRKTAKDILADSFRELAQKKKIDKITIKDIAANGGYSPATFYRQFKDKYDLIAWDYARGVEEIMNRIGSEGYSWRETLIDGANYYQERKEYLTNLLLHTSGLDSFVHHMTEINYCYLKKHVMRAIGEETPDEKTEMVLRVYCLGTVLLTCEWILGRYEAGPEELAEVFENALPAPLRPYLIIE
jgi:AcrR family transcriptional regulator